MNDCSSFATSCTSDVHFPNASTTDEDNCEQDEQMSGNDIQYSENSSDAGTSLRNGKTSDSNAEMNCQKKNNKDDMEYIGHAIADRPHCVEELSDFFYTCYADNGCERNRLKLVRYRRCGLNIRFTYKCSDCERGLRLANQAGDEDLNKFLILGGIPIGAGHRQLEKLFAELNIRITTLREHEK